MEKMDLKPFLADSFLTDYIPIPRSLVALDIPSTALLIYGALLDRGTLSQKNHYADDQDRVYVIYPNEHLARNLGICVSAVRRHLNELENIGLIRREPQARNQPNRIYLHLPQASLSVPPADTNRTPRGAKTDTSGVQKVTANNKRKQQDHINYYQHREEESL